MNFADSEEEAAFRASLRTWLAENNPGPLPGDGDERREFAHAWHQSLYRGGWIGLTWPKEAGGRELSPVYEAIYNDELGRAGAPPPPASINYLARALMKFGSAEQQRRYLSSLQRGDEKWCQGFSEPDAGSDLASLRTRARRDGDHYIVSGQKVWTSGAQWADWCFLLARTNPDAPRHKGISCLIVDMSSPGLTVRPIRQISDSREFCEVFFDEVRVPVENRIGNEGDGWRVAMTTVAYERGPADIGTIARCQLMLATLRRAAAERPGDDKAREELAERFVELEVLRLHVQRSMSARAAGREAGAEGSTDKLLMTMVEQRLLHTAMRLLGSAALLGEEPNWLYDYMRSRAASVYGGTEQIQKNILATRVLGLGRTVGPRSA